MPSATDELARKLYEQIKDDLKECNTAECRAAREEAATQYKKIIEDSDTKALKKLEKLDEDIVKLLEGLEKQMNTPIEVGPCPHCGWDSDDKPPVVGKCPDGCSTYDEYDKKLGMKKCTICGEDIDWNE